MKNLPFGPVALLAVAVLLTAPVALGIQLFKSEQGSASRESCLFDGGACQLRNVARFADFLPQLVAGLLAQYQSPTKRGQT